MTCPLHDAAEVLLGKAWYREGEDVATVPMFMLTALRAALDITPAPALDEEPAMQRLRKRSLHATPAPAPSDGLKGARRKHADYMAGYEDGLRDAATPAPALDVERLARALHKACLCALDSPGGEKCECDEDARVVARAYEEADRGVNSQAGWITPSGPLDKDPI